MKKTLLFLLTGLAFSLTALRAQTDGGSSDDDGGSGSRLDVRKLRIGVYLAPTVSYMRPTASTDDDRNYNVSSEGSITGFMAGFMGDYFFGENYILSSGLQYNTTGGKILATRIATGNTTNTVRSADFRYRLTYLEIPIMLKLRTDEIAGGFRPFVQTGFTGGINIGKSADYTVDYFDSTGAIKTAEGERVKLTNSLSIAPVMLQFNVGIGTEYAIGEKLSAYAGIFFNNGFTPDATKPNNYDNDELGYNGEFRDAATRLNNFALRVGLFF